jgi:hypothetical protein
VPVTIAVVRNECSVGDDVGPEFSNCFQQLSLLLATLFEIQIKSQIFNHLQCLVNIPMPEIPFEACEFFFYFGAQIRFVISFDALAGFFAPAIAQLTG